MPDKIIWLGEEFGKYIIGKVMVRKHFPRLDKCQHYNVLNGNFAIHENALIDYPNSWKEVVEEVKK